MLDLRTWLASTKSDGSHPVVAVVMHGMPISMLIKSRFAHLFGWCSIIVGIEGSATKGYTPYAKCWVCSKESPQSAPSYATIRSVIEAKNATEDEVK